MDGTRMGSRSSTRHGPAAVFSGPVRRWRKAWAPISSSSSSAASSSSASRILLYKWVPLTPGGKDEGSEEPTPHTVRYMPVSIVLAQKKEASRRASEEVEAAAEQNTDASGEAEAQADISDHLMVSAEVKASDSACASEEQAPLADEKDISDSACASEEQVPLVDGKDITGSLRIMQASDSACASEEQVPLADGKDITGSEEKQSKSDSPSSEGDVAMADEVQDQAPDVKPAAELSGLDLESSEVPSEPSPKSEAER